VRQPLSTSTSTESLEYVYSKLILVYSTTDAQFGHMPI